MGRVDLPPALLAGGEPAGTKLFYRLIRLAMARDVQLREPFDGSLECDETTFGSVRKVSAAGKVIVFGFVKPNGLAKAQPIPAHDRA